MATDSYTSSISSGGDGLKIGRGFPGGEHGGRFDGLMDEVAVYNRALSDSEIEEMYSQSNNNNNYCLGDFSQQSEAVPEVSTKILQIITLLAVALIVGIVILKRK